MFRQLNQLAKLAIVIQGLNSISCHGAFIPPSQSIKTVNIHSKSFSSVKASPSGLSFDTSIEVSRRDPSSSISTNHEIKYHVHNRMKLSSMQKAPFLVLHGGPGVPSDYLHPLVDVIPYRSIVFYDQLGCGRSPGPNDKGAYSIESSIDDLELLIKKSGLRRFHLYGQSFGGILAFEYLKRVAEKQNQTNNTDNNDAQCLSVILSSTPSNVEQVEQVANSLITKLLEEDDDTSTVSERFRIHHQCRTEEKPQALKDAYEHAGEAGIWRGTDCIKTYKAIRPRDGSDRLPSCLILRGEFDFVTEECVKGWKDAFNHNFVRMKVLENCSHHGLLEQKDEYGEMIESFISEYD